MNALQGHNIELKKLNAKEYVVHRSCEIMFIQFSKMGKMSVWF